MSRYVMMIMTAFKRLPNKHCRKVGENESLDKGHQTFKQVNENSQRYKKQR